MYGEKIGVAFQLLDDVIDLSAKPEETGKVPGTDLRAGVPTMPYLLLKAQKDATAEDLAARIDDGVALIADGADPAILDGPWTSCATTRSRRRPSSSRMRGPRRRSTPSGRCRAAPCARH